MSRRQRDGRVRDVALRARVVVAPGREADADHPVRGVDALSASYEAASMRVKATHAPPAASNCGCQKRVWFGSLPTMNSLTVGNVRARCAVNAANCAGRRGRGRGRRGLRRVDGEHDPDAARLGEREHLLDHRLIGDRQRGGGIPEDGDANLREADVVHLREERVASVAALGAVVDDTDLEVGRGDARESERGAGRSENGRNHLPHVLVVLSLMSAGWDVAGPAAGCGSVVPMKSPAG